MKYREQDIIHILPCRWQTCKNIYYAIYYRSLDPRHFTNNLADAKKYAKQLYKKYNKNGKVTIILGKKKIY